MATPYRIAAIFGGTLVAASFFWYGQHAGFVGHSALFIHAVDNDQAIETVEAFAYTNQFLARTTTSGRFQSSVWGSRTPVEQEQSLKKNLDVSQLQNGEVLTINFFDPSDQDAALVGTRESVETLIRMSQSYLNIDTLHVLDEPAVEATFQKPYWYALEVLLSAVLSTLLIELLIQAALFLLRHRTTEERSIPTPDHFVPEKIEAFHFPQEPVPAEAYDETPVFESIRETETTPGTEKVVPEEYAAPMTGLQSVSMSMEDLPFELETPHTSESVVKTGDEGSPSAPAVAKMPEPSVVEYKRRLNELLRG